MEFEFEFGKLMPASAVLSTTVEGLQQVVVQESGSALIIEGVTKSAAADYALVALGADAAQAWLTSRLFLLAAFLERNRVVRCIVFTGERGAFIGAASPRDVRAELGAKFPEYEQALLAAYGNAAQLDRREFRGGDLSQAALTSIAQSFLQNPQISSLNPPTPSSTGWVFLDRSTKPPAPSTWELAEHVTAGGLRAMLRDRLAQGSVVGVSGVVGDEDFKRAIINRTGTFVALVTSFGEYRELCDRTVIADKVARTAVEQIAPA
jgi:hypothetical protein